MERFGFLHFLFLALSLLWLQSLFMFSFHSFLLKATNTKCTFLFLNFNRITTESPKDVQKSNESRVGFNRYKFGIVFGIIILILAITFIILFAETLEKDGLTQCLIGACLLILIDICLVQIAKFLCIFIILKKLLKTKIKLITLCAPSLITN